MSVASLARARRRLRFFLIERLVLPIGALAFRTLMRTWSLDGPDAALIAHLGTLPRVIFTFWHGNLPNAMGFHDLFQRYERRVVGLTTPSLDGRLLAAALGYLDVDNAPLRDGIRGVAGAADFVQRIAAGSIGVIAADGPRGPRHVVKDGLPRTVDAADAVLVVTGIAATRGLQFGSWDRVNVASPFARVSVRFKPLAAAESANRDAIQAALDTVQREAEEAAQSPAVARRESPGGRFPRA